MPSLEEQIEAISRPQTREQVIDYFKRKYPGQRVQSNGRVIEEWKSQLAAALEPVTGFSRRSLQRRFQAGREQSRLSARAAEEYRQLGALLPRIAPEGGYSVTGTVYIKYSKTCEARHVDLYITGRDADLLAMTADVQVIINVYNEMAGDDEAGYPPCDEPELDISAAD